MTDDLDSIFSFKRGRRGYSLLEKSREAEVSRIIGILWPLHNELRDTWVPNLNCFNVNVAMEDCVYLSDCSVDPGVFLSIKMMHGDLPTPELVEFVENKIARRLAYRSHHDPYTDFQVLF